MKFKKEQHNTSEVKRILQEVIRTLRYDQREFKIGIKELNCINEQAMKKIVGLKQEVGDSQLENR